MGLQQIDVYREQSDFFNWFGWSYLTKYDCYTSKEDVQRKLQALMPNNPINHKFIDLLWKQRKSAGQGDLFMSPVIVHILSDYEGSVKRKPENLIVDAKTVTRKLIFRVLKCWPTRQMEPKDCCALFIDEQLRVYQNWQDFTENNKFGEGVFVAPSNGIYTQSKINCSIWKQNNITKYVDIGIAIAGVTATTAIAVVAFIPATIFASVAGITTAAVVGAEAVGISASAYSIGRSAYNLVERHEHKQTICITDKHARGEWLNVALGTVTVGALGAANIAKLSTANGAKILSNICKTIPSIMSGVSFTDAIITICIMHANGEKITSDKFAQISAALFVFTHNYNNDFIAQQLISCAVPNISMKFKELMTENVINSYFKYVCARTGHIISEKLVSSLTRIEPICEHMLTNCKNVNDLQLTLINLMEELTLGVFDTFINIIIYSFDNYTEKFRNIFGEKFAEEAIVQIYSYFQEESYAANQKPQSNGLWKLSRRIIEYGLPMLNSIHTKHMPNDKESFQAKNPSEKKEALEQYIQRTSMKDKGREAILDFFAKFKPGTEQNQIKLHIFELIDKISKDLETVKHIAPYKESEIIQTIKEMHLRLSFEATHKYFKIIQEFVLKNGHYLTIYVDRKISLNEYIQTIGRYVESTIPTRNSSRNIDEFLNDFSPRDFELLEKRVKIHYISLLVGKENCTKCNGTYYNDKD